MNIRNRFMRFASVGIVNTLIDAGLFAVLHVVGLSIGFANFISSSAGVLTSLVLNSRYTFQVRKLNSRQVTMFIAINLVGLWIIQPIAITLIIAIIRPLGIIGSKLLLNFCASLCATLSTFLWNYVLYARFVYKTHDQKKIAQ